MAVKDVENRNWILALFVRDDGERFLLGDGGYEFNAEQLHFAANEMANDVIEVQGNDGFMLAGQVRRPSTQEFNGYIGDSLTSKATVESMRKNFFSFFRKNFYYKVIYVFSDGSAIQRKKGFLVDAPEAKELYQIYPEYHVALNFEDINYYYYDEDDSGSEIYGKSATIPLNSVRQRGGLIWMDWETATETFTGTEIVAMGTIDGGEISDFRLLGQTEQDGTPTPNSPIPVNVVTGRQMITISGAGEQSQEFEVNLGKNLFDNSQSPVLTHSYTTTTQIDSGVKVTYSRASTSASFLWAVYIVGLAEDYLGKTLTLSASITTSEGHYTQMYIGSCNESGDSRVAHALVRSSGGDESTSWTVTSIDSNRPYICVTLYAVAGDVTSAGAYTDFTNLQLEVGATATDYVDYFEPIELCEIGDYRDYIYQSGGDWYVHKETEDVTLDGSESWGLSGSYLFYTSLTTPKTTVASPMLSDKFIWTGRSSVSQENVIYTNSYGAAVFINPTSNGSPIATTTSGWTTWLASNNITVYYVLATPTDTQITDSTLISQLDAVAGASAYAKMTKFTATSSGDLAAVMSMDLEVSTGGGVLWDEDGAEWEEGKPAYSTIAIDSIDNGYPVVTISGRTVNPVITNVTAGIVFSYNGAISESQVLVVDMMNKTALLNGTSVVGNVSGEWLYLKPGNNRITYTASNTDAPSATLEWQEIVG